MAILTPNHGVLTLAGFPSLVCVDRGHLIVKDGNESSRFSRVRHGLKRLVLIGNSGTVSLAAMRWLSDQKAALVLLERDGNVLCTVGPVHTSDARLRRAQALAAHTGADLRIAIALITAKLRGQEGIARDSLHNFAAAENIAQAHYAVESARTIPAIRGFEARAAFAYWKAWRNLSVNFPKVELRRVPDHWRTFGTRYSPITGSPRCAANPANATLNFLYAILEVESRLALATVGLDPGLGLLHVDSPTRDSLACDLMEPVRPQIDAYVLDWLLHRLFRRKNFFEMVDGTCRLMAELCAELSQTARTWGHAVAPWAELVARTIWATVEKSGKPPATPLTGDHRREGRGGEHTRPVILPPKPATICKECGVKCERTYCTSCGTAHSRNEFDKGRLLAQSPESRARRSTSQKLHAVANRDWKKSKEFEWLDRKTFVNKVQPCLAGLTVSVLRSILGVSEPYAAFIRSGSRIPHPRHWPTLARLVGISSVSRPH